MASIVLWVSTEPNWWFKLDETDIIVKIKARYTSVSTNYKEEYKKHRGNGSVYVNRISVEWAAHTKYTCYVTNYIILREPVENLITAAVATPSKGTHNLIELKS